MHFKLAQQHVDPTIDGPGRLDEQRKVRYEKRQWLTGQQKEMSESLRKLSGILTDQGSGRASRLGRGFGQRALLRVEEFPVRVRRLRLQSARTDRPGAVDPFDN